MKQIISLMLAASLLAAGCAAPSFVDEPAYLRTKQNWAHAQVQPAPPHGRPIFIGRGADTGKPMHWPQVRDAIAWADVVMLGERHDDQVGHDTKLAVLDVWDGQAALAMEMFTRDQQAYIDDWLADIGATKSKDVDEIFRERVDLWGNYDEAYAPLVNLAKERGWHVYASNAPRRYVKLARTEGFLALRALTPEQRRTVAIPDVLPTGEYRRRFDEVMGHMPVHGTLDAIFRAQTVWDTTMADVTYMAHQRNPRGAPVFHVNGAFHSDFDGGIVAMLRRRNPMLRILTISFVSKDGPTLEEDDFDRADIIIYTGEPPEPEEAEEEEPEAPAMPTADDPAPVEQPEPVIPDEPTAVPEPAPEEEPEPASPPIDLPAGE
ncbi:MAG: ChaN family lipoprotein [Phycisphaerales bacterium]|nr:ChaN family lipoprotein [Phycisphaerales bacterium]